MEYCLFCFHNKEIEKYQKGLVNKLYKEFNFVKTKKSNNYAHFTLKYHFEANPKQLDELKKVLLKFSKTHKKQKTIVGGFDNFRKEVIFIKVKQTPQIKKTISELHKELRKLKWMPWADIEKNGIFLHTTLAHEGNKEVYPKVMKYLKGKEKYFDIYFDNISIVTHSKSKKPKRKYVLVRRFNLKQGPVV